MRDKEVQVQRGGPDTGTEPALPMADAGGDAAPWVTVARAAGVTRRPEPMATPAQLIRRLALATLVVLALVGLTGLYAAQRLAEREAIEDAAEMADLIAETVVQPNLDSALLAGDPAAIAAFDRTVHSQVLENETIMRVKLWTADGKVIYADEPALIGQTFELDADQQEVLETPATHAEVSSLEEPENRFEVGEKLVEVYRPVWTPDRQVALFEIYTDYGPVAAGARALWRGFAAVTVGSLLVLVLLMWPLLWSLLRRLRASQGQREELLQRAVDASADERRRIAATLHDGPVQELAGASFVIAGDAARARAAQDDSLAESLTAAAATVRSSIGSPRSLLVEIYPPSLDSSGLAAALADLAHQARGRGIDLDLDVPAAVDASLSTEQRRLVYRVAQECLRNVAKHAAPCRARVRLRETPVGIQLDISDDGVGFEALTVQSRTRPGHLGLQVLADLAQASNATLQVASAPGRGTCWRLLLPPEAQAS